jgi:hypothetical protein
MLVKPWNSLGVASENGDALQIFIGLFMMLFFLPFAGIHLLLTYNVLEVKNTTYNGPPPSFADEHEEENLVTYTDYDSDSFYSYNINNR